uniref:Uncharacterized protein n=2 Tax=Caenorhabditis japonica TaxID=281687 RepID=A0A8R1IGU5_CAEJA
MAAAPHAAGSPPAQCFTAADEQLSISLTVAMGVATAPSYSSSVDENENQPPKKPTPTISIGKFSLSEETESGSASDLESETDWHAVVIASVVTFIAAIENTVVGMSEWPYMNQIDKEANAQFFGNATAASKLFHAISALLFAVWCQRKQSFRLPLIFGRIVAFLACILYLCVEMFTDGRRYVMAVCYVLFGVASSSSTILRAYVAAISHTNDRPQAYSGLQAAIMVSIIEYYVLTNDWCRRRSDVAQYFTAVSQRILRNSEKLRNIGASSAPVVREQYSCIAVFAYF